MRHQYTQYSKGAFSVFSSISLLKIGMPICKPFSFDSNNLIVKIFAEKLPNFWWSQIV